MNMASLYKSGRPARLWLFALVFILALTMSGCGRNNEPEPEPTVASTTAPESTDAEVDSEETESEEESADAVTLPTPTPAEEAVAEEESTGESAAASDASSVDSPASVDAPHGGREGMAAYMSDEFHGQATASGLTFDKDAMMAAHKSLPFESEVIVTNPENGVSVTVIIVDRLPERAESIIDVSSAAAVELDMLDAGMVWVVLEPTSE